MSKVRTRFAPSPTGRMHVGNLRSALYEFLIAKHEGGDFMLRIEDTDQERFVEGAVDIIYRTLDETGLVHDEGPDKDGGYGPYVQSERMKTGIYMKYAKELVEKGEAYYCFCDNFSHFCHFLQKWNFLQSYYAHFSILEHKVLRKNKKGNRIYEKL